MSVEEVLSNVPLFAGLSDAERRHVVALGRTVALAEGAQVFRQGDASDSMFVLLDGRVRISKSDADDNDVVVATMEAGEFFGELAMLDGRPRSASAAALTRCEIFALDRAPFVELLLSADSPYILAGVLVTLVDRVRSTTEKVLEQELARKTLHMAMEAERLRSLTELVAGVAHELNTPLGVASMAASLIQGRLSDPAFAELARGVPDAEEALQDVLEAADLQHRNILRAHRLVEELKHVAVNQLADPEEDVDVSAAVREALDLFALNARRKSLEVTLEDALTADQRRWLGHPSHLTQVLTNLLFNADRHGYPEGKGGRIALRLAADASRFTLSVQDFGRGISEEARPQIFTPFYTTRRGEGGSGLGLAIVHNLVTEGLKGTIGVDSAPGQGTTVSVRWPRTPAPIPAE